jgi:hypothetical protein
MNPVGWAFIAVVCVLGLIRDTILQPEVFLLCVIVAGVTVILCR